MKPADDVLVQEVSSYLQKLRFASPSNARYLVYRIRQYDKMRMRVYINANINDSTVKRIMIMAVESVYG